ncbi:MAG: hypothetical protein KDD55_06225 [Bdellovibrionales bacterium]|nr:hypothetical protein [Bdellovibrionales bacterium]
MAFVSIQNLVAPLTNKVHLISIIAAALTFAVFRMSGGHISIEKLNVPPQRQSLTQEATPVSNIAAQMEKLKAQPAARPAAPSNAPLTQEQVFVPSTTKKSPTDNFKAPGKSKSSSTGLEEIERSLGLR